MEEFEPEILSVESRHTDSMINYQCACPTLHSCKSSFFVFTGKKHPCRIYQNWSIVNRITFFPFDSFINTTWGLRIKACAKGYMKFVYTPIILSMRIYLPAVRTHQPVGNLH